MIHINEPAYETHHRIIADSIWSETGSVPQLKLSFTAFQWITFGVPYLAGFHGILIELNTQRDPTGATADSYTLIITYPTAWDGIGTFTTSGASFIATIISLLDWFDELNLKLEVDAECNWILTSNNGFNWDINGSTVWAVPPFTQSGSGYDRRENRVYETSTANPLIFSIPIGCPVCATNYADQITKDHSCYMEIRDSGYEYKKAGVWTQDPIDIQLPVPTDIECSCKRLLGTITGTHSYNVGFAPQYRDLITKTFTGTTACPFPPPPTKDQWSTDQTWLLETIEVSIVSKYAGILETETITSAQCNEDTPITTDNTVTEPHTILKCKRTVVYAPGHSECEGVCGVPS